MKSPYSKLYEILPHLSRADAKRAYTRKIIPYLMSVWIDDYEKRSPAHDLIETSVDGWSIRSYLFDISESRLVAAWAVSEGKDTESREEWDRFMRKHPLSHQGGERYHRGHAVPHTLGGRTDINLVSQLGKINSGAFQVLERLAVATPGSLYFTYWLYGRGKSQTPVGVEQGLLIPGEPPRVVRHAN